jgi:hypothetical protein
MSSEQNPVVYHKHEVPSPRGVVGVVVPLEGPPSSIDLPGTITLYRFDESAPPAPEPPPMLEKTLDTSYDLLEEQLAGSLMRTRRLEAALEKALSIVQFSLANLDGNIKGWPEDDIRNLGGAVASDEKLSALTRQVGFALQIWAAPVLTGPTVEQKPERKRTLNSQPQYDKVQPVKRTPGRKGKPNPKAKRRPKT